ncbi:MAG: glycoside hydrolase family 37 [Chloroflexi bacterium]|nr:glycoside hydrolase family 37 [Chloroflexota bacterium]
MHADAEILRRHIAQHAVGMLHAPTDLLPRPYLVPGSVYSHILWDWDSWLCSVALLQALHEPDAAFDRDQLMAHMQGSVLNFLDYQAEDGYLPICIEPWLLNAMAAKRAEGDEPNQAKPVLSQFAALISRELGGDAGWLGEDGVQKLERFIGHYRADYYHAATGLYYWHSDLAIGVDNEPAVFGRPRNSAATIYMNTLMVVELGALAYLEGLVGREFERAAHLAERRALIDAIQRYLWDARDGWFYNADLQCRIDPVIPNLHANQRDMWPSLPVRILGWTGVLALWAGIATAEQAARVAEHLANPDEFASAGGVRTLAACEPMYNLAASGNPSNWLGPVWGISNYMAWAGLQRYGYRAEAADLCRKTAALFAGDVRTSGVMHEYYAPETMRPIINPGFMNWNYLVLNMLAGELGDRPAVREWLM